MSLPDRLPITKRGKELLESELKKLLYTDRPECIKAIEEARSHGDLSENAEYDAAKERQSLVEGRILEVQGQLAGAEIIDPASIKSDRIVFGATVTLMELESEEEVTYQIVGIDEADVKSSMISILSPIARSLIGRSQGETVLVKSPKGEKEYEIIHFEYK